MNNADYEVPQDLKFSTLDLTRLENLDFTLKLDKKYYENILEKPNKITSAVVSCSITVNQKDIFVNGSVSGGRELQCGRCLDFFKDEFKENFNEILSTKEEIIDIMNIVRETLALTDGIRFLCKETCKGLCDVCGVNKNKEKCDCVKENFSPFAALKKDKI